MTDASPRAVTLVVCAAPLAERATDIARAFVADDWSVRVVVTPTASGWVDSGEIATITGEAPTSIQRRRDQGRIAGGTETVVLVAPLTFNTLNKWAAGIADNYALGVLCEALSLGKATVAVPVIGERLWSHPIVDRNLQLLAAAGIDFVNLDGLKSSIGPLESGRAPSLATQFDVQALVERFA